MFQAERKPGGLWFVDWIVDAYYSLGPIFLMNLLWFVFSLPVITVPPAYGALVYSTNLIARDESVSWRTFMEGFRLHFWRSWRWFGLNLFVVVVSLSNLYFYRQFDAPWVEWVQGLVLALTMFWGLLNIYTFPLLMEQTDRRIKVALRNSLVLFIRRPLVGLGTAIFIVVLFLVSLRFAWPAWIVIVPSLAAYLANRAAIYVVDQLSGARRRQIIVQTGEEGLDTQPGSDEKSEQE
jgi:uncharacterized membrane protein YesL